MKALAWPCPAPGGSGEEFAIASGPEDARHRILIVPALFEEANRTRRMLAQAMRALATRGIAAILPDLPGCGESLSPLRDQSLASWRQAMESAARHFAVTRVLSLRHGALIAPAAIPGWRFEAAANVLRPLLRARTIAAREEGREETIAGLLDLGRADGLELAGYRIGAALIRDLDAASLPEAPEHVALTLAQLGGEALWLRSEPGEDDALSSALADRVGAELAA